MWKGHISRNCPDNSVVQSQGHGPPGTSTFSVEPLSLVEEDDDERIEVLDSLPLGAISIEEMGQVIHDMSRTSL